MGREEQVSAVRVARVLVVHRVVAELPAAAHRPRPAEATPRAAGCQGRALDPTGARYAAGYAAGDASAAAASAASSSAALLEVLPEHKIHDWWVFFRS